LRGLQDGTRQKARSSVLIIFLYSLLGRSAKERAICEGGTARAAWIGPPSLVVLLTEPASDSASRSKLGGFVD